MMARIKKIQPKLYDRKASWNASVWAGLLCKSTWNFTFSQLAPRPRANGLRLELSDYKCAENHSIIGAHSGWGGKSLTWLNNNRRAFPLETQFSFWASWSLLSGMNEKWELVINVLQAWSSFTNCNKIEKLFRMHSFSVCDIIVYFYAQKYRFYCTETHQSPVVTGWWSYD